MTIGELRKAMDHYTDDVPVAVYIGFVNGKQVNIPVKHAFGIANHTDTDVGAFIIDAGPIIQEVKQP